MKGLSNMATIKQYTKTNGIKLWMFQVYLGIDEATNKRVKTTRRNFKTKKEAQLALNRLKLDFNNNGFQHPENMTFEQVYERWLQEYRNTVKESTLVKTKVYFNNHILPAFGNMLINKISIPYAQSIINDWCNKYVKYSQLFNYTSAVFQYAMKLELVQKDPTKLVVYPKRKEEIKGSDDWKFYDKEELQKFFACLAEEDKHEHNHQANTLFRLLAFTGMRKGEALALTWQDIDFTNQTLTINKALSRGENARLYVQTPKTSHSNRTLDIDKTTIHVLKKWKLRQREQLLMLGYNANSNDKQLVFSNTRNGYLQPSKPRKWLVQIINKYQLKYIKVHGFRHTHASLLFEAGASIKEVQERLGHSDIKTTMNVYAHVSKHAKKDTVEKFVNYVNF